MDQAHPQLPTEVAASDNPPRETVVDEPKKPFSETWKADFLQKLALLVVGFALTGIFGVLVAEHVKRSFAIQDLRISGYKDHLEDQRKLADTLTRKINGIGIKTEVWARKLEKYWNTPQSDDLLREFMLDSLAGSQELSLFSKEYSIIFCENSEVTQDCYKLFASAVTESQMLIDAVSSAAMENKLGDSRGILDRQLSLLDRSGDLESFMFNQIRLTRQRYENEITKQPWW